MGLMRVLKVGVLLVGSAIVQMPRTVGATAAENGEEAVAKCDRPWPENWTDFSALKCNAKEAGTFIAWLVAAGIVLYVVGGLMFRFVKLNANSDLQGTLRRAREQLPFLGRTYRPRIEFAVSAPSDTTAGLATSVGEVLVHEITAAAESAWVKDRLAGDELGPNVDAVLSSVQPKFADIGKVIQRLLPNERVRVRVQLHEPTTTQVAMTVEFLDRAKRSLAYRLFVLQTFSNSPDRAADHYLLARSAAAWILFQFYSVWPGELDVAPTPVNTSSPISYGYYRQGVELEHVERPELARTAYLRAVSEDPRNVGALLRLAALDIRDYERIEIGMSRLGIARVLVAEIEIEEERARLLTELLYVLALGRLAAVQCSVMTGDRTPSSILDGVDDCASAVRELAGQVRILQRLGHDTRPFEWEAPVLERFDQLGRSYVQQTLALAGRVAIEYSELGRGPLRRTGRTADDLLAAIERGELIHLDEVRTALAAPDTPITTTATYHLACALARLPNHGTEALRQLREAIAGDASYTEWVMLSTGEPALHRLRDHDGWSALRGEFAAASARSAESGAGGEHV
jgi:hypothetical protein